MVYLDRTDLISMYPEVSNQRWKPQEHRRAEEASQVHLLHHRTEAKQRNCQHQASLFLGAQNPKGTAESWRWLES